MFPFATVVSGEYLGLVKDENNELLQNILLAVKIDSAQKVHKVKITVEVEEDSYWSLAGDVVLDNHNHSTLNPISVRNQHEKVPDPIKCNTQFVNTVRSYQIDLKKLYQQQQGQPHSPPLEHVSPRNYTPNPPLSNNTGANVNALPNYIANPVNAGPIPHVPHGPPHSPRDSNYPANCPIPVPIPVPLPLNMINKHASSPLPVNRVGADPTHPNTYYQVNSNQNQNQNNPSSNNNVPNASMNNPNPQPVSNVSPTLSEQAPSKPVNAVVLNRSVQGAGEVVGPSGNVIKVRRTSKSVDKIEYSKWRKTDSQSDLNNQNSQGGANPNNPNAFQPSQPLVLSRGSYTGQPLSISSPGNKRVSASAGASHVVGVPANQGAPNPSLANGGGANAYANESENTGNNIPNNYPRTSNAGNNNPANVNNANMDRTNSLGNSGNSEKIVMVKGPTRISTALGPKAERAPSGNMERKPLNHSGNSVAGYMPVPAPLIVEPSVGGSVSPILSPSPVSPNYANNGIPVSPNYGANMQSPFPADNYNGFTSASYNNVPVQEGGVELKRPSSGRHRNDIVKSLQQQNAGNNNATGGGGEVAATAYDMVHQQQPQQHMMHNQQQATEYREIDINSQGRVRGEKNELNVGRDVARDNNRSRDQSPSPRRHSDMPAMLLPNAITLVQRSRGASNADQMAQYLDREGNEIKARDKLMQSSVFNCLVDGDFEIVKTMTTLPVDNDRNVGVVENLVKVFDHKKLSLALVKHLVDVDISGSANQLFRSNTLCTSACVFYMKLTGANYLRDAIGNIIYQIIRGDQQFGKKKKSCEINPDKFMHIETMEPRKMLKKIEKNSANLLFWCDQIYAAIVGSLPHCPASMRKLFHFVRQRIKIKLPDDEMCLTTGPSGFIWLRFICAALISPKQFGLWGDEPISTEKSRDLLLIAKVLQNLANLREFGAKEKFMEVCNPWILSHKPQMVEFVNSFCSIDQFEDASETTYVNHLQFYESMNKVISFLYENFQDLQKNCPNQTSISKLHTLLKTKYDL